MADPTKLRELLDRLEKLEGPCREIDTEIVRLVVLPRSSRHKLFDGVWFVNVGHPGDEAAALLKANDPTWVLRDDWRRPGPYDIAGYNQPAYTASLDAALELVGRVLPEHNRIIRTYVLDRITDVDLIDMTRKGGPDFRASAKTPALALLAALLSALEARDGG